MRSPQEFRIAVYEKKDALLAMRKRRRRKALFCAPLAVAVLLCGVFGPGLFRKASPVLSEEHSSVLPRSLQVGRPAAVVQKAHREYSQELAAEKGKEFADFTNEDWEELEQRVEADKLATLYIEKDFQTALNNFARDSTAVLAKDFGVNDCYCPLSLYYALALTGAGARGNTETEFQNLLKAPDMTWAADQCGRYYRQHYCQTEVCTLQLANSLWMDGRCAFLDDYISNAEENFYSALFQADFTDPEVGGDLTEWVKENTGGLLAPEFRFHPDTMLSVINTVYFQARWSDEFSPRYTESGTFTRKDGTTVTADFMPQRDLSGSGLVGDGYIRADRNLRGGARMIFILPDEGVDPLTLLQDPDAFAKMFCTDETDPYEVIWRVPKFSIDSEYDLMEALNALGLSDAMDSGKADFSGMYDPQSLDYDNLYLSQAKQGVHIGIDEQGVIAAAYTEMEMLAEGALDEQLRLLEMTLDRPFLFAIVARDNVTEITEENVWPPQHQSGQSILFVGVCGDPTAVN